MANFSEIVFAVRNQSTDGHWYANIGPYCFDPKHTNYGTNGHLCKLNPHTGELTVLLADPEGAVRDPVVHYDGQTILFSYRPGGTEHYHLHEIQADGSGLRQITDGPWDDFEACYVPDGGIVFVSTRANRYVQCWVTQVATLHRCDRRGRNIRTLSGNVEQDNTPWVLPDGRILYTRWEYIDRNQVSYHHLWTMRADGSGQMVYFGNMHYPDLFIDAKPIPGSSDIVMINSPGHGRKEHAGRVETLNVDGGPDERRGQRVLNKSIEMRDPYPLSADTFLVADKNKLLLMDRDGNTRKLYQLSGALASQKSLLHEPRPLQSRPREPVLASNVNLDQPTGTLLCMDVGLGRNMEGVLPGQIKKLLVLETLPKPVNYTGGMSPLTYGGSFSLNRVLGTVPVEADGSVFMEVPANRSLFFVALDANDLSVKRMQSFVTVMPGEHLSCIGCHEERDSHMPNRTVLAQRHPPRKPQPLRSMPAVVDYPRDIQPIWDRYCLDCHDTDQRAGGVLLTGDNGPQYTLSYFELSKRLQMADGRNQKRSNLPPRTIGSSASPLMQKLNGSHHDVTLEARSLRLVKLWLDSSATYPGTYAALGSGMIGRYIVNRVERHDTQWPSMQDAMGVMKKRCASCHTGKKKLPTSPSDNLGLNTWQVGYAGGSGYLSPLPWLADQIPQLDTKLDKQAFTTNVGSNTWMKQFADPRLQFSRHTVYNLTRPDQSVLLKAPLTTEAGGYGICGQVFTSIDDPGYRALLKAIRDTGAELKRITRFNMPGFIPEEAYFREMKRYGILAPDTDETKPLDVYATDEAYWQSFTWRGMVQ